MVLSSTVSKSLPPPKASYRFNKRRLVPQRKKDDGFIVSSPLLIIRRKSRKINGEEENLGEEKIEKLEESKNGTLGALVLSRKKRQSFPYYPLRNVAEPMKRRQSFSYYPSSFSEFNLEETRPVLRQVPPNFGYVKLPQQYALRHQYIPESFVAPPRKLSRISNDVLPLSSNKPLGLQLVESSYNCALGKGAPLKNVLISWTKTPVRVFGGAILKKVDPFCIKTA